mgnify:FL=1|tara:strand:+ start:1523 stop:1777 length:255 start_codon:yes stop_codon:yes gene_type:complete
MEYDNTNTGVLFRNETANEENKQPYMTGNLNVDGKELSIAGWMKVSKTSGKKFLSLKVQEPRVKEVPAVNNATTNTTADAEMPF